MDEASFAHFNALRQAHFPPERNHIPAHVTLFHALPGGEQAAIEATLATSAAATPPFTLHTEKLQLLGRGNAAAYMLESPEAQALRRMLARHWQTWLSPQDAQGGFRPHITVQNKVKPETARALLAELSASFQPQEITAVGLDLWIYQGGPWQFVRHFGFSPLPCSA